MRYRSEWFQGAVSVTAAALLVLWALGMQRAANGAAQVFRPQAPKIEEIEITGTLQTADGKALPPGKSYGLAYSLYGEQETNYFTGSAPIRPDSNGVWKTVAMKGGAVNELCVAAWADGYAPALLPPIDIRKRNRVDHLDVTLNHGFDLPIRLVDDETGKPIPDARLEVSLYYSEKHLLQLGQQKYFTTDSAGTVIVSNCGPVALFVNSFGKEGYETAQKRVGQCKRGEPVELATRRAVPIAGVVTDQTTGKPIAGAFINVLFSKDAPGWPIASSPWGISTNFPFLAATTDQAGRFAINQYPRSGRFWLIAHASGHANGILSEVRAGQTNLQLALGPEMVVHGRITGNLSLLPTSHGSNWIWALYESPMYGDLEFMPTAAWVRREGNVGYFGYTNAVAGPAVIKIGPRSHAEGLRYETNATASINDWVIELPGTNGPAVGGK